MPTPTPTAGSRPEPRVTVPVRLRPESVAAVDAVAEEAAWTRSQAVRQLLVLGLQEWRAGRRTARKV